MSKKLHPVFKLPPKIKYTPLQSIAELISASQELIAQFPINLRKVFYMDSQHVVFINEEGKYFATHYRPEIYGILEKNGYQKKYFFVAQQHTFPNKEYKRLAKAALQQTLAYVRKQAASIAQNISIPYTNLSPNLYKVTEIVDKKISTSNGWTFAPLQEIYSGRIIDVFIGKYFVADEKTLYVGDGYGRTFAIECKSDSIHNKLIEDLEKAGYQYGFFKPSYKNLYMKRC